MTAWQGVEDIIVVTVDAAVAILGTLLGHIKTVFSTIWDYLKSQAGEWKQIGKDLMAGLANGIKDAASIPVDAVKKAAGGILSGAKNLLRIQSPSRAFMEVGKFVMMGLAVGIADAAPMATKEAEAAAAQVLAAFEETAAKKQGSVQGSLLSSLGLGGDPGLGGGGGFGGDSFGGGFGGGSGFGEGGALGEGSGGIPGLPNIDEITAYYDERLTLLRGKGAEETDLFRAIEAQKTEVVGSALQTQLMTYGSSFGSILDVTKQFAGEQSGIYQGLFALNKAFAIADSIVSIQKGIASAASLPFPTNIPAIASVISATAGIVSTIQSVSAPSVGAFNNGGTIPTGRTGIAGEKGVELVGPKSVLSTQRTKEMFAGMGGGGGGNVMVVVNITNNQGDSIGVSAQQSGDEGERIDIIIDKIETKLAGDARRGTGKVFPTFAMAHGLTRTGT